MCTCTHCFAATSVVIPAPVITTVERGALLLATSGEHVGDMYMLVRETDSAYAKDAAGNNIGSPKYLFNLINLTNEGKTRVSTPERKFIWGDKEVPVGMLCRHFGFGMDVIAKNIGDASAMMNLVKNTLLARKHQAQRTQVITIPTVQGYCANNCNSTIPGWMLR